MQKRRRFKQTQALEGRLADQAKRLSEQAAHLPPGKQREAIERKARFAHVAAHICEWLSSPGLRPPE
ncbi:hypothetical protein QA643_24640 [Bradyrhizobium sp. CB3481]|nr:hypothetical protein [Bradyrhizobium sp. CB3481]WFU14378.1 hypothetical protein QA643_24640 [Bradyrhizobium sp. CB3481]